MAAARAALARSGYKGQRIPLSFARDLPIGGVAPMQVARAVQAQLARVGIRVTLDAKPASQALAAYRSGRNAIGLWGWDPDYVDPENYLTFGPGNLVGQRAGWVLGSDDELEEAATAARVAYGDERPPAFARWQQLMNERSPFVPLLHPMRHHAHGDRVNALPTNPVWTLDIAAVR